ncbi:hypothetical protein [Leptolyngbya phage Lbo-JY46]
MSIIIKRKTQVNILSREDFIKDLKKEYFDKCIVKSKTVSFENFLIDMLYEKYKLHNEIKPQY